MSRRTICNLSRELQVSRPRIYRAIERLGIEKKAGGEYSVDEWAALKQELQSASGKNRKKQDDAKEIEKAHVKAHGEKNKEEASPIETIATSTLLARLERAKQEFDYNRLLISTFQDETTIYVKETGRTTAMSHNGAQTVIPSITNLEKYVKLNISLSKLITDLENDLDLTIDGGDDPFA